MKHVLIALLLVPAAAIADTASFLQPVQQEMQQQVMEYMMDEVLEHPDKIEEKLNDSTDAAISAARRYEEAQSALWMALDPKQAEKQLTTIRKNILIDCRIALNQSLWAGSPEKDNGGPGPDYPEAVQALIETIASQTQTDINMNMGSAAKVQEAYLDAFRRGIADVLEGSANPVTGKAWTSSAQQNEVKRLYKNVLKTGAEYREALMALSIPDDEEFWSTGLPMFKTALTCRLLDSEESMLLLLLPAAED